MAKHRRPAFTLLELLIVLTIIAVLVALLLPALTQARQTAMMAQNISNERQIVVALHTYAEDNQSSLPYGQTGDIPDDDVSKKRWGWYLYRDDYVTDWRLYWSPFRDTSEVEPVGVNTFIHTGYGANRWGPMPYVYDAKRFDIHPLRLGQKIPTHPDAHNRNPVPAELLLLAEVWQPLHYNVGTGTGPDGWWVSVRGGVPLYTCQGKAARAYLDGHANMNDSTELGWRADSPRTGAWINASVTFARRAPWFRQR